MMTMILDLLASERKVVARLRLGRSRLPIFICISRSASTTQRVTRSSVSFTFVGESPNTATSSAGSSSVAQTDGLRLTSGQSVTTLLKV